MRKKARAKKSPTADSLPGNKNAFPAPEKQTGNNILLMRFYCKHDHE